ncbi:MAG: hypothetical protein NVS4B3_05670 [Gemmatimonadaceae bacterium]
MGRITAREEGIGFDPQGVKLVAAPLEIGPILPHFFRFPKVECPHVLRRPPVGNMHEHDRRAAKFCEPSDMDQNARVSGRVFERD